MSRFEKIQIACVFYLVLSIIYTLFSYQSKMWYAFNYIIGYAFIAFMVDCLNEFSIINRTIACLSIGRCIINVYYLWVPDIIFSKAVCLYLIVSCSIYILWTTYSHRFSQGLLR